VKVIAARRFLKPSAQQRGRGQIFIMDAVTHRKESASRSSRRRRRTPSHALFPREAVNNEIEGRRPVSMAETTGISPVNPQTIHKCTEAWPGSEKYTANMPRCEKNQAKNLCTLLGLLRPSSSPSSRWPLFEEVQSAKALSNVLGSLTPFRISPRARTPASAAHVPPPPGAPNFRSKFPSMDSLVSALEKTRDNLKAKRGGAAVRE